MQIIEARNNTINQVAPGKVFEYNGDIYVRTDSNELTALHALDGSLERIHLEELVNVIPNATLKLV